jgi:hypothetical protein
MGSLKPLKGVVSPLKSLKPLHSIEIVVGSVRVNTSLGLLGVETNRSSV